MTDTTFIYALLEPESDDVRYIGKTDDVKRRLTEHVNCRDEGKTHKTCWVYSLRKQGKEPKLIVLEEVPIEQWQEAERRWIAYYREAGALLTNIHPGGGGGAVEGRKRWKNTNRKAGYEHAGRPKLDASDPTERFTVTLPNSLAVKAAELGNGNLSAGVRMAIEAA